MRKLISGKRKVSKVGPIQQKILLLLEAGLALSLVYSPRRRMRIIRGIGKEWEKIDQKSLLRSVNRLYESKLIQEKHHADGTISLTLNKSGKIIALRHSFDDIKIPTPPKWDGKWRLVLFDIPEELKKLRDTFRGHLKRLGFYEFQQSVFIYPFECSRELDFIIEYYNARRYIRYVVAEKIDNLMDIRRHFPQIR